MKLHTQGGSSSQSNANTRGVSSSSHNANKSFGSQTGQLTFKQQNPATGQENRRPMLQRMFGPGGKAVLNSTQTNSVGPASRGGGAPSSNSITVVHSGFMSGGGGSKQKQTNNSTSGIGLHSTKQSSLGGLNSAKNGHLARIPNNQSVISAAPASHPPALAQYGAQSLDNSQNNIIDVSNNAVANQGQTQGSTGAGATSVAQRSLSRARQFGKDLTNMFSFTRNNQSRQSSKQSTGHHNQQQAALPQGSANQPTSVGRHKVISGGSNNNNQGSLPRSARHNQQPHHHPGSFDYSGKNTTASVPQASGSTSGTTQLPSTIGPQNAIRKSSLNPQNALQKSLNSLDFKQHKNQGSALSSSLGRPSSGLRSRDKLPQIVGTHTKLANYQQRIEQNVNSQVGKVDKATISNIYHVSQYCREIQQHMQLTEKFTQPDGFYMRNQRDINENVRAILVDWIISVHAKFKLLPETLYLTINLVDRYFSIFNVLKSEVQLVGVAALLIATKYEEIYPPTVKDFIYLTDNTYTRSQILTMEQNILFHLQFEIQQTSSYRFLERYWKISQSDTVTFLLAQYLLELSLLDSKMNQYKSSLLASTALYVAMRVQLPNKHGQQRFSVQQQSVWSRDMIENTGYTNTEMKHCAKNYFQLASLIQRSELQAILRKFTQPKYMEVARIMNTVTKEQERKMVQASKSAEPATASGKSRTATNSKHHASRTQTTNSSNGKQKRGVCSSTGKITNISNMNSTSGSHKQMTAKNHKTSSSNAMSSAESKKI